MLQRCSSSVISPNAIDLHTPSSLLAFICQSLVASARPLAVLSHDCFIQHLLICKEQAFKAFEPGFAEMQWLDDLVGGLQATFQ
jgi:hypothetical protein